jgi:HD-GYP domain-containing protein (c-di-GMP phosphodiesterase class II)
MTQPHSSSRQPTAVRLAELLAALSLAMDIGLGQPMEHVLRTCLIAMRLGLASGASDAELRTIYYGALLRFVGCTADAHETAAMAGGDDLAFARSVAPTVMGDPSDLTTHVMRYGEGQARVFSTPQSILDVASEVIRTHCEVASMIARRLGLGETVEQVLWHGFARWDGRGFPSGAAGDAVPLASRIAVLARDAELLTRTLGAEAALGEIRNRRGRAYDPRLVDLLIQHRGWCVAPSDASAWDDFLATEPDSPLMVGEDMVDRVLEVFADFVDSKVPALLGHSRTVAAVAQRAARELGCTDDEIVPLRRAALVHDIGRVGVPNGIWERSGPLAPWEWERVRLHPYFSERVLARCGPLASLAPLAGSHHERLDGSGYYRGSAATTLSRAARLLAAADVFAALSHVRPHRPAQSAAVTVSTMRDEVRAGRLDGDAVDAILAVAGVSRRANREPALGTLTERELDVLRLICHGHANRVVAEQLGISPKTVDHHVQHIYRKTGVSTRASLAVLALERGLLQE